VGASRPEERGNQPTHSRGTTNLNSQGKHTDFLVNM